MRFLNGSNIQINPRLKVNSFSKVAIKKLKNFSFFLGHAVVEMSTKDFFTWLQQAETEVEEGEEEEEEAAEEEEEEEEN
jgi:hypothetical protein